jgi:hypothetical protein
MSQQPRNLSTPAAAEGLQEGGWMLMTALFMLLLSTLVLGLFGSLAAAEVQAMRFELDAVRFEALRDAALAQGLGLASTGAVAAGQSVPFQFELGGALLYGTAAEITGRDRPAGRGIYLIEGTVQIGHRKQAAQVQLNTLRSPPEVSRWKPVEAF